MIKNLTLKQFLPYIFLVAGILGIVASGMLTYDKIQYSQNTDYQPICNINPVFSCVSVMTTEQSSLLGIPNPVFGLMGFTALVVLGVLLLAGTTLKRWMWVIVQLAATAGVIFMHYLFFQAVWRIGAICPWCFVVWMITIPTFWYTTLYNLRQGHIKLPVRFERLNGFLQTNHGNLLILWYGVIFAILAYEFWYYWSTLI